MTNFVFDNPTKLLFGTGKLGELHKEKLPGKKALLLLSQGQSVHRNGSYDKTVDELNKAGVTYVEFARIMENPLVEVVEEGGAFARENGCDFIVALGGGAVLDSSVAVATMATGLRVRRLGKGPAPGEPASAGGDDRHLLRHRFGDERVGRHLQGGHP